MKFKLKQIVLQNFMTYAEKVVDFQEVTFIKGKNGKGKSSILNAYMWALFNCDYELNDNPKIRKDGVVDADVSVTVLFDVDGKEVSMRKVQRRKFSKDGSGYSDDNSYFINEVFKTMRDFNEYLGIDMTALKICSNLNAFLAQKSKEMRDLLFATVDDISDYDVASCDPELADLVELLSRYKLEEIDAMNKATKSKVSKELPILDGQIKEAELNCQVLVDTAELELKKNLFLERIAEAEAELNDSSKVFESYQNKMEEIANLKKKLADMERAELSAINQKRSEIQSTIDVAESKFVKSRNNIKLTEITIDVAERDLALAKSDIEKIREQFTNEKKSEYPEYAPLPEFDPTSLVCPACGQDLPTNVKSERYGEYELRVQAHEKDYAKKKALFLEAKEKNLAAITKKGNDTNAAIKSMTENLETYKNQLAAYKEESVEAERQKNKAMEQMNNLPSKADLSDNQEYINLMLEISDKTNALESMDTGKDYRAQLNSKLTELRAGLLVTEKEIAKADTTEAEERLEQLREQRMDLEQSKADSERILDLLDKLDKSKNEMLAGKINEKFKTVSWMLFELNKSGGYKSVCIPTIDGKSLLDISSNKGNRILGKLDICNSIQKIKDLNVPVFLDDAESLDDENVLNAIGIMDCQMVLLKVSNDIEVKVEVA